MSRRAGAGRAGPGRAGAGWGGLGRLPVGRVTVQRQRPGEEGHSVTEADMDKAGCRAAAASSGVGWDGAVFGGAFNSSSEPSRVP